MKKTSVRTEKDSKRKKKIPATTKEVKIASKKVMKKFSSAIKRLADR